ncbi:MAG: 2-dehydro-3-deoxygalactonokinase, partial [Sediminibacterium sp.]
SNKNAFEKGITDSMSSDLLHHAFHVRTNDLFNNSSKQENYYYLSGLLIGAEINQLKNDYCNIITVVCSEPLFDLYSLALNTTGITNIQFCNADDAIIKGQQIILQQIADTTQ